VITVGEIHKEYVLDHAGTPKVRDVVEMGFTIDERIADGFYFARSIKLFKYLISQPDLLEQPFKEEVN
jgi:pyruvate/2-oxoglutarate dehydrogenase complex dihydrolipoamide acyltransferase (E2) component